MITLGNFHSILAPFLPLYSVTLSERASRPVGAMKSDLT